MTVCGLLAYAALWWTRCDQSDVKAVLNPGSSGLKIHLRAEGGALKLVHVD